MSFFKYLQENFGVFKFSNDVGYKGPASSSPPIASAHTRTSNRSITASIYNRICIDVSGVDIRCVKVDQNGSYLEDYKSSLNRCLTLEANIDQTHRELIHDATQVMLEEGCVALVPIDVDKEPDKYGDIQIKTLRAASVVHWYPEHVRVNVYNERRGYREEVTVPKSYVTIITNPLYSVMNEPNSTLKRLTAKLTIMDLVDEQIGAGKLNLFIQLPYSLRTKLKKKEAEDRLKQIEEQLTRSKYGLAFTDGTEKITQIGRPLENNMLGQIEYLSNKLYSELGLTPNVFNGTANEAEILNYHSRTIAPILNAIVDGMVRKFVSDEARDDGVSIMFFKNSFDLATVENISELADKLTRNEIMSSNEVRAILGYRPSKDPKADQLINKNLKVGDTQISKPKEASKEIEKEELDEEV